MHIPLLFFAAKAILIAGFWWWLGAPVAMPPSPLAEGDRLYCLSYAPFRGTQTPLNRYTRIDAAQIDDDLARLAKVTGCVRTYALDQGLDQVPALAEKHGLQVMQGIWLSADGAANRAQIEAGIALAKQYPETIRSLVVGNEVLLRGEIAATDLAGIIREVAAAVSQPVTYADVWEFWLRHRDVYAAVDFVTVHILPYWEDHPVAAARAGSHVQAIRERVARIFPDKEIVIGETGWPSAGRMRDAARPSPADQARVLHDILRVAAAENYRVNLIESHDQPWKRALEGTVGGYWGLFDNATREPKFAWGQPVSNHPHWLIQAAGGIALAAIVFLAAWTARRRDVALSSGQWTVVGAMALASGATVGLAAERIAVESLGAAGWVRGGALGFLALAGPLAAAAAFARGTPIPSFARLLGGRPATADDFPRDALTVAVAGVLIVLCLMAVQVALGLVFDPRYKDFPIAALTGPVVAYLLLLFARPRPPLEYGAAERAVAAVLLASAAFVALNEGFANWEAQWFVILLAALGVTLLRAAGVRRKG